MSKNTKSASVSDTFAKAVLRVLQAKCVDGSSTSASTVAKELKKSRQFGISNLQLLRLMVSQAVAEGAVPGATSMTGRPPSGGIYLIDQRDEWNAKVEAAES